MHTPQRTVLMLGAGASHASDFRLPTMVGFFDETISELPELAGLLERLYPGTPREQYNLEDVLAFLDISRARLSLWGIVPPLDVAETESRYQELIGYVRRRLEIPPKGVCSLTRQLLTKLRERDSILTFNYDLVCDYVLASTESRTRRGNLDPKMRFGKLPGLIGQLKLIGRTPPSILPWESEAGFYLKLHGSLDWLYCPNTSCANNVNIFSLTASVKAAEGQQHGKPCRLCGAALTTLIVPPVAAKRLDDRGRLAFLWNLALRELLASDDIVIVGVSFAASDFELRWLLRTALIGRMRAPTAVSLVNPDRESRGAGRRLLSHGEFDVREYESIRNYLGHVEVPQT